MFSILTEKSRYVNIIPKRWTVEQKTSSLSAYVVKALNFYITRVRCTLDHLLSKLIVMAQIMVVCARWAERNSPSGTLPNLDIIGALLSSNHLKYQWRTAHLCPRNILSCDRNITAAFIEILSWLYHNATKTVYSYTSYFQNCSKIVSKQYKEWVVCCVYVCPCASSPVIFQHGPLGSQRTGEEGVDHSLESSSVLHSHASGLNHTAVLPAPNCQHTACNVLSKTGSLL